MYAITLKLVGDQNVEENTLCTLLATKSHELEFRSVVTANCCEPPRLHEYRQLLLTGILLLRLLVGRCDELCFYHNCQLLSVDPYASWPLITCDWLKFSACYTRS